jgi:hypothetical protein
MILIKDNTDLFTLEEKGILEKKCSLFTNNDNPAKKENFVNYYVREYVDKDDPEFQTIISKINNYVIKSSKKDNINLTGFWINKVTNETNKNDDFHKDYSDITFLMYLNDEFMGGEYEYIAPESKIKSKIKPKKYLSIITDKNIPHRVNPVLEGERYSIVFFYDINKKINKSLI